MTHRVRELLEQISKLEQELRTTLAQQEHQVLFQIRGKRVEFERSVMEQHRKLKVRLLRWLGDASPRHVVSVPFIYGLIVPFVLLDVSVTLYQAICFPLYRIGKVKRADYIVIDRNHLGYLNIIEKLNCVYCGYANGLIAYVREIASRTEQYWCPIKHAHKVLDPHARHSRFLAYGEAIDYQQHLESMRKDLAGMPKAASTVPEPNGSDGDIGA